MKNFQIKIIFVIERFIWTMKVHISLQSKGSNNNTGKSYRVLLSYSFVLILIGFFFRKVKTILRIYLDNRNAVLTEMISQAVITK
jgi:hypothetical protein